MLYFTQYDLHLRGKERTTRLTQQKIILIILEYT